MNTLVRVPPKNSRRYSRCFFEAGYFFGGKVALWWVTFRFQCFFHRRRIAERNVGAGGQYSKTIPKNHLLFSKIKPPPKKLRWTPRLIVSSCSPSSKRTCSSVMSVSGAFRDTVPKKNMPGNRKLMENHGKSTI